MVVSGEVRGKQKVSVWGGLRPHIAYSTEKRVPSTPGFHTTTFCRLVELKETPSREAMAMDSVSERGKEREGDDFIALNSNY